MNGPKFPSRPSCAVTDAWKVKPPCEIEEGQCHYMCPYFIDCHPNIEEDYDEDYDDEDHQH